MKPDIHSHLSDEALDDVLIGARWSGAVTLLWSAGDAGALAATGSATLRGRRSHLRRGPLHCGDAEREAHDPERVGLHSVLIPGCVCGIEPSSQ